MNNIENNTAGVDFSINAPAVVLKKDNVFYQYCILRNTSNKLLGNINTNVINFASDRSQVSEMEDINKLTDIIINILLDNNIKKVYLEGYSYSSYGSSFIQLIAYQTVLRYKIFINNIELNIVSPKTVKLAAGKGNLDKLGMFESFCNLDESIYTFNNNFIGYCYNNRDIIYKKVKSRTSGAVEIRGINKPYEDIIDAFFCLRCNEK